MEKAITPFCTYKCSLLCIGMMIQECTITDDNYVPQEQSIFKLLVSSLQVLCSNFHQVNHGTFQNQQSVNVVYSKQYFYVHSQLLAIHT